MSVAISVQNPVSYLICMGLKDVENRNWQTDYRGRLYIHSSGDFEYKSFEGIKYPKKVETKLNELDEYIDELCEKEDAYNSKIIQSKGITADDIKDMTNYEWYRECAKLDKVESKYEEALSFSERFDMFADNLKSYYGGVDMYSDDDSKEYVERRRKALKRFGNAYKNFSIIGYVDLVDIVTDSKSMWAEKGNYHWILKNPVLLKNPIINVKGKLRIFDVTHII